MKRIILLRHGESEWNRPCAHEDRKFTGQYESPLTEEGIAQAVRAADTLRALECNIDHIMCSTIGRARQTAHFIRSAMKEAIPVTFHDALRERSLGVFEGRKVEEVFLEYPEFRHDFSFCNDFVAKAPGGENLLQVTQRAWAAWEQVERMAGNDALIVSHAVTIRCLIGRALSLSEEEIKRIQVPNAVPLIFTAGSSRALLHPDSIPSSVPPSTSIL